MGPPRTQRSKKLNIEIPENKKRTQNWVHLVDPKLGPPGGPNLGPAGQTPPSTSRQDQYETFAKAFMVQKRCAVDFCASPRKNELRFFPEKKVCAVPFPALDLARRLGETAYGPFIQAFIARTAVLLNFAPR